MDQAADEAEGLDAWIASRDGQTAVVELRAKGVSAAVVNRGSDMLKQFEALYQVDRSPNGDLVKGFPFQLQETPLSIRLNSPEVGEHTAQFVKTS